MNKFTLTLLLALPLLLTSCRIKDERQMTVNLPTMESSRDQTAILNALSPLPGIDKGSLRFDRTKKLLMIRYDSMIVAEKNIEIAIAEAGYTANAIEAIKKR